MQRTEQMNASLLSYRVELLDRLTPVLEPLSSELSIHAFGYRLFFPNGKSFGLCSNNEWNVFFENQFLPQNDHISRYGDEVAQTLKKGKYFCARTGVPDPSDRLCSVLYGFDIWNSLCIYYKNEDFVESFYFTSTKENRDIINFYLNNLKLLERYASHFKGKFLEATNLDDLAELSEPTVSADIFANQSTQGDNEEIKIKSFSESLPIRKLVVNRDGQSIVLSKREAECLCYMAFGKTMKEIATCLNLSPRTVEFYVDNMKKKTGFYSKSQLLNMFFSGQTEWPIPG